MINRRRARQLVGETIREIGLLLIVFGPLDALFQHERPAAQMLTLLLTGGLLLTGIGIIIEAREDE